MQNPDGANYIIHLYMMSLHKQLVYVVSNHCIQVIHVDTFKIINCYEYKRRNSYTKLYIRYYKDGIVEIGDLQDMLVWYNELTNTFSAQNEEDHMRLVYGQMAPSSLMLRSTCKGIATDINIPYPVSAVGHKDSIYYLHTNLKNQCTLIKIQMMDNEIRLFHDWAVLDENTFSSNRKITYNIIHNCVYVINWNNLYVFCPCTGELMQKIKDVVFTNDNYATKSPSNGKISIVDIFNSSRVITLDIPLFNNGWSMDVRLVGEYLIFSNRWSLLTYICNIPRGTSMLWKKTFNYILHNADTTTYGDAIITQTLDGVGRIDISPINPNTAKTTFLLGSSLRSKSPINSFVNDGLYDRNLMKVILDYV